MPGKIKVKVLAGRNLPVMDRAGDTTDAFVEIKFGGVTHKTDVCRKSLNPHWNSTEWYRFEVDESELQDEPLQLRLMDHDTYSANDAIGKVVISLAPLLARESVGADKGNTSHSGAMMSGWIPVFDTMHGIRGELNLIVKVELFSDFNKYKTSSCGVQFFHSPMIPPGYKATAIHGFVEELVVNDDPEYQWIDKIRTPRASNEARQVAFIKLSNQVQRLVGVKAAELGANAVVGYQQDFDLEGEAGVVARAIGTAVSIEPLPVPTQIQSAPPCTQQQLKKYLGILTTGEENVTDLNQYFQSHQEELNKLINILHPKFSSNFLDDEVVEEDEKCQNLSRQCSIKSYTDNASIFQDDYVSSKSMKAISDDQTDLNKFLSKTIDELDTDNQAGPMTRVKKTKKNFFTKRLSSIRSRKSEKGDDSISIKSNSSDGSKLSFSDIKKEFKKFKRIKAPKIIKVEEDDDEGGAGMASILARSIIHAHTSLACIAESQDSEHSPSSTMRRTSESEPTISVCDEEVNKPDANPNQATESQVNIPFDFTKKRRSSSLKDLRSLNQASLKPRQRTLSESCPNTPRVTRNELLLKLPGNNSFFGSNSSALSESSEMYSSSEADDDESDDPKTDTDKSIETTSSIVQSVINQKVDPKVIAQMDRKLSILETVTPEPPDEIQKDDSSSSNPDDIKEMKESINSNIKKSIESVKKSQEPSTSSDKDSKKSSKRPSLIFKFHNPFHHKKSISAPSSPVEKKTLMSKSSDKIKEQWTKTKTSMIRSISHTFLHKRKNSQNSTQSSYNISQPNSGSDIKVSHETVLGSPFLSYTDLVSLDKDTKFESYKLFKQDNKDGAVKMYIGSEPASRASVSGPSSAHYGKDDYSLHEQLHKHKKEKPDIVKPTGLIHTAMETILIDKVQSLLIPTTPDPELVEKLFFDDVNKRLEKVEDERKEYIKEVPPKPSDSSLSEITIDTVIETKNINIDSLKGVETLPEFTNISVTETDNTIKESQSQISIDKHKKLTRQDSIHSLNLEETETEPETELPQTIDVTNIIINPRKTQTPVLQHFHPILIGIKSSKLETIPSLPESSSLDRAQSLDTDGLDSSSNHDDANSSVINQHVVECSDSFDRIDRDLRDGDKLERESSPQHSRHESYGAKELVPSSGGNASLNATSTPVGIHRRSSDSDLSITPKASSLNTSTNQGSGGGAILRPSMNSNNLDMLEYPFLTMTKFPPGFIVHLGGCVTARAVKLLDGGGAREGDDTRAAWWSELRTELRAHARAARCHCVIAYTESATICEEVCVLSASGTAAVINLDCDLNVDPELYVSVNNVRNSEDIGRDCSMGHVPYSAECGPYRAELASCLHCRRAKVPAVLLATCSKPTGLASTGKSILLTACAARVRRAPPQAEPGARDISDQLPFLEYELHKLLLAKLRMQGANAIFDLHTQLAIGARCVTALAYGTAFRLNALPPPTLPNVKSSENDKEAIEIQKALWNAFNANKTANGYDMVQIERQTNGVLAETEGISPPILDLCSDKDACVLELDETEDVETAKSLALRRNHMEIYCDGMNASSNMPPQAFAQIWRARFPLQQCTSATKSCVLHVNRATDGVAYKLRRLRPSAIAAPHIHVELPEKKQD